MPLIQKINLTSNLLSQPIDYCLPYFSSLHLDYMHCFCLDTISNPMNYTSQPTVWDSFLSILSAETHSVFHHFVENSGLNYEILGLLIGIMAFLIPISLDVITSKGNSPLLRQRFFNTKLISWVPNFTAKNFPYFLLFFIFALITPKFFKGIGVLYLLQDFFPTTFELLYLSLIVASFVITLFATGRFFHNVYLYSNSNQEFLKVLEKEIERIIDEQ